MDDNEAAISDFLYHLCGGNKVEEIRNILPTISNRNIMNRFDTSTVTTCLHAASYYGHRDVVQILLDYGAIRSIRNFTHNLTPFEEAHAMILKNDLPNNKYYFQTTIMIALNGL